MSEVNPFKTSRMVIAENKIDTATSTFNVPNMPATDDPNKPIFVMKFDFTHASIVDKPLYDA